MISLMQKLLPDNTHHSQLTNIHAPAGFEPAIPASEGPLAHALDRAADPFGKYKYRHIKNMQMFLFDSLLMVLWWTETSSREQLYWKEECIFTDRIS
jgi:hypothetical protein